MNLYKLCLKDDGDFYSFGGRTTHVCLKYELNRWTYPNFGKIFVFDTIENAQLFKKVPSHNFVLFECEVLGEPEYCQAICDWLDKTRYRDFWEKKDLYTLIPPKGTMIVDAVKLIKEVQ